LLARDYITNTTYVKYKYEKNPHNSLEFSGLAVRSLKNLDRVYKTTGALLSKALLLRFKAFPSHSKPEPALFLAPKLGQPSFSGAWKLAKHAYLALIAFT